jgi:hypothetical protein
MIFQLYSPECIFDIHILQKSRGGGPRNWIRMEFKQQKRRKPTMMVIEWGFNMFQYFSIEIVMRTLTSKQPTCCFIF